MTKKPLNTRRTQIHQVKLISLTGEPIRIVDVQSAVRTGYADRFMFNLCRNNYVLDWKELETRDSQKVMMCMAHEINRQFRHCKTALRLVIDGIR